MSESTLIHLAADLSHYHTDYLWKMPGSWEGYPYYSSPEFYEDIARTAARGIMDMLFFGDSGGSRRITAAIVTPRCATARSGRATT